MHPTTRARTFNMVSQPATTAPPTISATLACVSAFSTFPAIKYSVSSTIAVAVRRTQRKRGMFTSAMPYQPTTMLATFSSPGQHAACSCARLMSGTSKPFTLERKRFANMQKRSDMACCAASSMNLPSYLYELRARAGGGWRRKR